MIKCQICIIYQDKLYSLLKINNNIVIYVLFLIIFKNIFIDTCESNNHFTVVVDIVQIKAKIK